MALATLWHMELLITFLLGVLPLFSQSQNSKVGIEPVYTFTLVSVPTVPRLGPDPTPALIGANLTLITSPKYDITRLLAVPVNIVKLHRKHTNNQIQDELNPEVVTNSGVVRGFRQTVIGRGIDTFLGIPFAEPPIGNKRFRRPSRVRRWSGILDALEFGHPCYQLNYTTNWQWVLPKKPQSEDCLTLNIWTPSPPHTGDFDENTDGCGHNYHREPVHREEESSGNGITFRKRIGSDSTDKSRRRRYCSALKTVLVFIYGGGFNIGSTDWEFYDGRMLAARGDIVVASMNYRLGPLGFLNANIRDVPGNMGLYDQQMAIRWIYENIRYFGGDPSKIVLMGESAGAVSVGLHLISPMSRYMIRRVIMHSGSPLWDTPDNTIDGPKKANEFAEIFGCANRTRNFNTDRDSVLQCLTEVNAEEMYTKSFELLGKRVLTYHPRYGDQFLPLRPKDAMRQGFFKDVDVFMGVNRDEGSIFVANTMPEIFMRGPLPNITRDEASLYMIFFFQYILRSGTRDIRDHYFNKLDNNDYTGVRQAFIDAIGDYLQICPTVYFGEHLADFGNDVYFYLFNHRPSNSYWDEWLGVAHFDEIQFAFGMPLRFPDQFTPEEIELSKRIMDIWITFSKEGSPPIVGNRPWPRYKRKKPLYMQIDTGPLTEGRGPHEQNCAFFKKYILR
ncbi:acetylcholinesterase-1-like isoform X2 [Varroa jacobsoni]|uniref:Carboxylic ester hydrolase n=1 Tax=Varroa destructor TaxID=109461 RepID=A0A7M7IZC5_VARDE|nr:acetylcholinesterase-1-like isoform X2 [Varroa destructor]XP_022690993.1 acetylcholinesterase-1-like isoform X2 [Varroa jacobsoni]